MQIDLDNYELCYLFLKKKLCLFFRIGEVKDEDVLHARVPFVARTQQCFAVKAGIHLRQKLNHHNCHTQILQHKLYILVQNKNK